jgi:hypothetical protein
VAGHRSFVLLLTRYGGDSADSPVDRLDGLEAKSLEPYRTAFRLLTTQVRGMPSAAGPGLLLVVFYCVVNSLDHSAASGETSKPFGAFYAGPHAAPSGQCCVGRERDSRRI